MALHMDCSSWSDGERAGEWAQVAKIVSGISFNCLHNPLQNKSLFSQSTSEQSRGRLDGEERRVKFSLNSWCFLFVVVGKKEIKGCCWRARESKICFGLSHTLTGKHIHTYLLADFSGFLIPSLFSMCAFISLLPILLALPTYPNEPPFWTIL